MEQSTNLGCLTIIFQRSAFNAADPYVYFLSCKTRFFTSLYEHFCNGLYPNYWGEGFAPVERLICIFFFNSESRLWKNNNSSRQKVHFALRKRKKKKKKARGARPHWDPFKKGFGSRESVRWGMHRWEGRRLSTPVLMQIFEYTWKIHFFAPFSPAKCVGGECESCCIDWLVLYKEYKLLLE